MDIEKISQNYDKNLYLDKELLIEFLKSTQNRALDKLKKIILREFLSLKQSYMKLIIQN